MKHCVQSRSRGIFYIIKRRKAKWIDHILHKNCLIEHSIEGKAEEILEVTGRRGRRSKQLLDDIKETKIFGNFKEKALYRTLGRTSFGRGYGHVLTL
jgi:hypothetical protein